ncbi:MAG TPA: peptidylprolyl isomerase [Xanthomonadales bacterium]|nr:peptidylprolyl isomerase [Xanthomonadales bacterium]
MSKWLKEPLLHFLVLGGLIFVFYGLVSERRSEQEIFISAGQQDNLINTFTRTWQRPPTPVEFKGLLDDYVREQIAYREAMAMGLDEDDVIIRRRLRQKLELLAEDVASLSLPSDAELQAFLEAHPEDYRIEPRYSLQQVYFSGDRREDPAKDAQALLAELQSAGQPPDYSNLGDPISLPAKIEGVNQREIARMFGNNFSEQLEKVAPGAWAGPLESGFGVHLVFVSEFEPGKNPELDEVRDAVQRDWFSLRRREAVDGMYARLVESYSIEVEAPEVELPANGASAEGAAAQ